MPTDYGAAAPIALLLVALVLVSALARRVPVLGRIVSLGSWGVILFLLFTVVNERGRFDPLLGRLSSALGGAFGIEEQTVTGGEVRIRMARDGHFWARARIDGVESRMLVDSGATVTALTDTTARDAGLEVRDPVFPMILRTANGQISAQTATIGDLRLGSIAARELAVVVSPAFGDTDVLGMNFLSKLASWRVEGRTLILVPHHPMKPA